MNKIYNCLITDVKTKITKDLTITVKLEFYSRRDIGYVMLSRKFYDVKENAEFKKIMSFAGATKIKNLKGRVIREVVTDGRALSGIGHPVDNNFCLFTDVDKVYVESDLTQ